MARSLEPGSTTLREASLDPPIQAKLADVACPSSAITPRGPPAPSLARDGEFGVVPTPARTLVRSGSPDVAVRAEEATPSASSSGASQQHAVAGLSPRSGLQELYSNMVLPEAERCRSSSPARSARELSRLLCAGGAPAESSGSEGGAGAAERDAEALAEEAALALVALPFDWAHARVVEAPELVRAKQRSERGRRRAAEALSARSAAPSPTGAEPEDLPQRPASKRPRWSFSPPLAAAAPPAELPALADGPGGGCETPPRKCVEALSVLDDGVAELSQIAEEEAPLPQPVPCDLAVADRQSQADDAQVGATTFCVQSPLVTTQAPAQHAERRRGLDWRVLARRLRADFGAALARRAAGMMPACFAVGDGKA